MNLVNIIISAVIATALAVGIVLVLPRDEAGMPTLGAVSSPDIPSPYFSVGQVREWKAAIPLKTGTTTICAIQSPAATSTLRSAGVRFETSSTTASTVTLAKASTAFATTTAIGTAYAVGANAQAMINASTSPGAGAVEVFAPNTWFVVGMAGGTGTFSPVGACHATFEEYVTL